MPGGTIDDLYLTWLYDRIGDVRIGKGTDTYWDLLRQLYKTEFTYFVPNDDDRASDGVELRHQWAHETHSWADNDWMALPCSFLEMLVALSDRMDFAWGRPMRDCFWLLIDNLGFHEFHDRSNYSRHFVQTRLQVVNERLYDYHGNGGLFPLNDAKKDQRRVDLWYQLCAYLLENP